MASKRKRARGPAGRAIRAYCVAQGISQGELARRIGYSRQSLSDVIRGTSPGRRMIEALVRESGGAIDANQLLGLEPGGDEGDEVAA